MEGPCVVREGIGVWVAKHDRVEVDRDVRRAREKPRGRCEGEVGLVNDSCYVRNICLKGKT